MTKAISNGFIIFLAIISFALIGCQTRSISNSGYQGGYHPYGGNPLYQGELSEFDVLGTGRDQSITEEEIGKALDNASQVKIKRGSSIMLIQSGAVFPDESMIQELQKSISVMPFSGLPQSVGPKADIEKTSYSKSLRMTAARGGHETIICYWGILESAREIEAGKSVSWIPIIGWSVPDETQRMRVKLKFAVINVRTGNWSLFAPEPFEKSAVSAMLTRAQSDQRQVDILKKAAYEAAAKDLIKTFAN